MKRWLHRLWPVLRWALLAYGLWLFGALLIQRRIVFPSGVVRTPEPNGVHVEGMQRHWLRTRKGRVEWWFFPHPDATAEAPAGLVVYAHGNGELIDFQQPEVERYRQLGFHVLLCEYRGYGRSEGSPSQAAILHDHRRVLETVLKLPEVDRDQLLYHGLSLGTGVVCGLARTVRPRALVLTAPFTSVADIMASYWVPRPLVLDPFDNEAALRELQLPTLVFHGERDRTIPVAHSKRLAALGDWVELVLVPNAGHNDLPIESTVVWKRIAEFARVHDLRLASPSTD